MSDYEWDIPKHIKESLDIYIRTGRPTGGFLKAVLCNDLLKAVTSADALSLYKIKDIVLHVNEHVPATAWGNERSMKDWIKLGGLEKKKQPSAEMGAEAEEKKQEENDGC